jgi:RNA polymerase sigma-70 factor (ECF subfamily)
MDLFNRRASFNPDNPESIIAACLGGNPQAQRALIKLFFGFAKSISIRYATKKDSVEEIINDSFLKVFNNLHKYDSYQPFKAWLRTIVVNTAIDYYRKNIKAPYFEDFEKINIVDLEEDAISKISADEIHALVQKLPPSYKMVFTLYVIEGYSHREIADLLGIKEGTSKSNLQDARRKLQLMILKTNPNLYKAYELKNRFINEN